MRALFILLTSALVASGAGLNFENVETNYLHTNGYRLRLDTNAVKALTATNWSLRSITNAQNLTNWALVPTNILSRKAEKTNASFFITEGGGIHINHADSLLSLATIDESGIITANGFSGSGALLTDIPESAVTDLTTDLAGKVPTSRTISTTSPLGGGGDLSGDLTLTIQNAAADGSTKGASTFTAADFNASSGVISLDYVNGQKASASLPGFLSSADWTTFNSKVGTGGTTTITNGGGIALMIAAYVGTDQTIATGSSSFQNITELSASVAAGGHYVIHGTIAYTNATSPATASNPILDMGGGNATMNSMRINLTDDAGNNGSTILDANTLFTLATPSANLCNGCNFETITVDGMFHVNAGGTIQFRIKLNTTDTVKIFKNSYFTLIKL